jgi:hypothetical protein
MFQSKTSIRRAVHRQFGVSSDSAFRHSCSTKQYVNPSQKGVRLTPRLATPIRGYQANEAVVALA